MNQYDEQAADFLRKWNVCINATLYDAGVFAPWGGATRHNKFSVVLTSAGRSVSFPFYDSAANRAAGKRTVSAYAVLACCAAEYNCPASYREFLADFGYEDCAESRRVFKALSKQSQKLQGFFSPMGEECVNDLLAIS